MTSGTPLKDDAASLALRVGLLVEQVKRLQLAALAPTAPAPLAELSDAQVRSLFARFEKRIARGALQGLLR
jgi:hypothetical protein